MAIIHNYTKLCIKVPNIENILNLYKCGFIVYCWKAYFKLINIQMTTMDLKLIAYLLQPLKDTELRFEHTLL